jgi:23S rRNA pseudoU1915 N3-methylase RlmH
LHEVDAGRGASPAGRKLDEARGWRNFLPARSAVFALDEAGALLTSRAFAAMLAQARDEGFASAALIVAGRTAWILIS